MFQVYQRIRVLLLIVSLIMTSCGLPGVAVEDIPTPTATTQVQAQPEQPDLQATVDAQVQATMQAQSAAAPDSSPTDALMPTTAPTEAAEATTTPTAASETVASSDAEEVQPESADTGDNMLIALSAHGLVSALTDEGWVEPQVNVQFYDPCVQSSAYANFDSSGRGWLSCGAVGTSSDGAVWEQPEQILSTSMFTDPEGQIWSVGRDEVEVLQPDGSVRTFDPTSTIGEPIFPSRTMAFDSSGTAWIGGPGLETSHLLSFDGETWTAYGQDLGLPSGFAPSVLFYTSNGELLAGINGGVYVFENDTFREFIPSTQFAQLIGASSFSGSIYDIIELPNGDIWVASEEGIFVWNGTELQIIDRQNGLPSNNVRDLELDAQDRVWAATSHGIVLQEGDSWQVAVPGTSGMTDSDILAIAIKGAPTLPPAEAEAQTTTITGRLVQGGQPVTNSNVQLCSEAMGASRRSEADTPCGDHFYNQVVQTDSEGTYRFENVPIGTYTLAAQGSDSRWYVPFSLDVRALEPGQTVTEDIDLGA